MKRTGSARKNSKSKGSSTKPAKAAVPRSSQRSRFVVCVKSGGYVDLEPLKVYRVRPDAAAKADRLLRIVDASGEDYLYPENFFRPIQTTANLFRIVAQSA